MDQKSLIIKSLGALYNHSCCGLRSQRTKYNYENLGAVLFVRKPPPSPGEAAVFCVCCPCWTRPGPAESHMTRCQVPEKSNNVRNSLIRYAWLQLQSVGLWGNFVPIEATWQQKKIRRRGGGGGSWGWWWHRVRHGGQDINMPMHTQACTHTTFSYVHVIHIYTV